MATGAITLVCGPPASGKTTFVRESMKPGDLVLDWDELLAALSAQPAYVRDEDLLLYANAALKAVLRALTMRKRAGAKVPDAWVIRTMPHRDERDTFRLATGARVVLLACPAEICKERIDADPARSSIAASQKDAVEAWWWGYVSSPFDEEVVTW